MTDLRSHACPLGSVDLTDGRRHLADGVRDGFPVWRYGSAPACLVTRRQLAEQRLRPGGDGRIGMLEWRRGHRIAYLFDIGHAEPKNAMTAGKWRAINAALAARRVCQICPERGQYVRSGLCSRCFEIAGPTRPQSR